MKNRKNTKAENIAEVLFFLTMILEAIAFIGMVCHSGDIRWAAAFLVAALSNVMLVGHISK